MKRSLLRIRRHERRSDRGSPPPGQAGRGRRNEGVTLWLPDIAPPGQAGRGRGVAYFLAGVILSLLTTPLPAAEPIKVGSKKFTESVILGEIATQLLQRAGLKAEHRKQLGGTQIVWQALMKGDIDVYPDYTGTLRADIIRGGDLEVGLAEKGIRISRSLGFYNSYALGMRRRDASERGITTISDLKRHAGLRYGFSEEFRNRRDGWPALSRRYGLEVGDERVRVLDHDLALRGLRDGHLDVADVYTTEGAIQTFDLVALRDDRWFFPVYEAVWVFRKDLPAEALEQLRRIEGRIREPDMIELNTRAETSDPDRRASESELAAQFLTERLGEDFQVEDVAVEGENPWLYLLRLTGQHLFLVSVSLLAAVVIAVPLGVVAAKRPFVGQGILVGTGVLQTIPSLALLVMLIPLFHLGVWPALVALFLYSLLPIVRNTHAGLTGIPLSLRESAEALGLPPGVILRKIELPLASRSILAGIKTAAVINVGNATLGALIDAGGYGEPILSGIRLNSAYLILLGAVPAAVLALLVQGLFELAERYLAPRGA